MAWQAMGSKVSSASSFQHTATTMSDAAPKARMVVRSARVRVAALPNM